MPESDRIFEATPRTLDEDLLIINGVTRAVTEYYHVSSSDLLSSQRDRFLDDARAVLLTIAATETNLGMHFLADMVERTPQTAEKAIESVKQRASKEARLERHLSALALAATGQPLTTTLETWPTVVEQVYDLPRAEVLAAASPKAIEARRVLTYLMWQHTGLRQSVIAERLQLPSSLQVKIDRQIIDRRFKQDSIFASRIINMTAAVLPNEFNEMDHLPPILTEAQIIERVAAYYNITTERLVGNDPRRQFYYPRYIAGHLVKLYGGFEPDLERIFGEGEVTTSRLKDFERKFQQAPWLQKQKPEIIDPPEGLTQANGQRIVHNICTFYGVESTEALTSTLSHYRLVAPRRAVIYALLDHLDLPNWVAAGLMGRNAEEIGGLHLRLKTELATNKLLAEELNFIVQAESIAGPVQQRVLDLMAIVAKLDLEEIKVANSPIAMQAQHMTIALLSDFSHISHVELVEYFDLGYCKMVAQSRRIVSNQTANNPNFANIMAWLRQQSLSEAPIELPPEAMYWEIRRIAELQARVGEVFLDNSVDTEVRATLDSVIALLADFYGVKPTEVQTYSTEFYVQRARRMAIWVGYQSDLTIADIATVFNERNYRTIGEMIKRTPQLPGFTDELEALSRGEKRPDKIADSLDRVGAYYNVDWQDLHDKSYWMERARAAYALLATATKRDSYERIFEALGWSSRYGNSRLLTMRKQYERDLHFRAEVDFLNDPDNCQPPVKIPDVIAKVSQYFQIDISNIYLESARGSSNLLAQYIVAGLLRSEMSLPTELIAETLGCSMSQAKRRVTKGFQKLRADPGLVRQIDQIAPPYFVVV